VASREGVWTPYYVAARLVGAARRDWERFDGWCASRGVNPEELPIDRLCNLVWFRLTDHRKPEDVERIEAQLWKPPKGEEAESGAWSAAEELAAFGQAATTSSSL